MKNMKKILALLIAMVMVLGMATVVFAAGTGSITITPPSGSDAEATNTYKIYKVFEADGNGDAISYKLVAGKSTAPAGFTVDKAGNVLYDGEGDELTQAEIDAIAAYVTEDDLVATVTATGEEPAVAEDLPNGYYYITTTTGTVVTIDSTNPNAEVNDKNTVPGVDKTITGATSIDADGKKALAQVGTTVEYSAVITVGTGAKGYIFHDTMEEGLTYNDDAAVTGVDAGEATYTVGQEGDDTFTITFADEYIQTLEAGATLTVTYSATVNDDAVTVDPLNNTAYLSYGDKNSNNKTPVTEADVYEAKFTVSKLDGDEEPLGDAGFVIANADEKYYKIENKVVSWVDDIDDATEYFSDDNGEVAPFTGLANGTYTLIEKTVPSGYNRAVDSTFTIEEHDYTAENLEQTATVINMSGTELPATGGMGTKVLYIIGGVLVAGAGIVLLTRKRVEK